MEPELNGLDVLDEDMDGDILESGDGIYSITSYGADLSFRELTAMLEEKSIEKPDIQRNYVWDKKTASRFIETILLGLPVPSIFLARTSKSKYLIVDGFQRLTTVSDFINGFNSDDSKPFKLATNISPQWAGLTFNELSDTNQRLIKMTTIHAIIFKQTKSVKDDTSLFQIFERINTGGIRLSPQEIRNSVYHNDFNAMLIRLNNLQAWRNLYKKNKDKRMRDIELILRFFLLFENKQNTTETVISLKREMNLFMDQKINSTLNDKLEIFEKLFIKTMEFIDGKDKDAFVKETQALDTVLYDSIALAVAIKISESKDEDEIEIKTTISEAKKHLQEDPEFIQLISETRRTSYQRLSKRHDLAAKYLFSVNSERN